MTSQRVGPGDIAARPAGSPETTARDVRPPAAGGASGTADGVAAVVGMTDPGHDAVVELSAVPDDHAEAASAALGTLVVREESAPVPAPRRGPSVRRGPWARLAALITGRRRAGGRHRPDEVPVRAWSMSAPSGRPVSRRRSVRPR